MNNEISNQLLYSMLVTLILVKIFIITFGFLKVKAKPLQAH